MAAMQEFHGSSEEIRSNLDSRALTDALDYWVSLRGVDVVPPRASFDPMAIATLLSEVLLIDVLPEDRFLYLLAGSEVERRYNVGSFAGKTPGETLGKDADKVLRPYRLVRDTKCLFYRVVDRDWLGRDPSYLGYKVLLLPFSAESSNIDTILGVFDFLRR